MARGSMFSSKLDRRIVLAFETIQEIRIKPLIAKKFNG